MGIETVVTLIAVAVLVGALAAYLIIIAATLTNVTRTVDQILNDVIYAVQNKTQGLGGTIGSIAGDARAIEEALANVGTPRRGGRRRQARAY